MLALADDERIPRSIVCASSPSQWHLDEFFQSGGRIVGQVEAGVTSQTADGRSPQEQIDAIASIARQQKNEHRPLA